MPQFTDRRSLAAGQTADNIMDGSQWEFMPFDAYIEIGVVGDAASHEVLMDVYSGQDVLAERNPISSAARFPVYPDDFTLTDYIAAGERLKIRANNTGAGAHVVQTVIRITQV